MLKWRIEMNPTAKICLFVLILLCWTPTDTTNAQSYQIPFGSQGNAFELEVVNSGGQHGVNLKIIATDIPDWIHLDRSEVSIENLAPKETRTVRFQFNADEQAEPGKTNNLKLRILENGKEIATREFALKSEAPKTFELFHNYPNPFNPATNISYQLPEAMEVNIQIYNILGQLVGTLVNEAQKPGKHELRWDASGQSSGVYLYRFQGTAKNGETYLKERKMLLIK